MPDNDKKAKKDKAHPLHYLMWFRRDLRTHDNTALAALCAQAQDNDASVTAVYFYTPEQWHTHDMSLAQVDHIARTLPILAHDLRKDFNITLQVYVCARFDDSITALLECCKKKKISCLMANHEYEGREIARDEALAKQLAELDITFIRHHDQCILPPQSITTNDNDTMYKVFTPFYKKWRHTLEVSQLESHNAVIVNSNNETTDAPIPLTSVSRSASTHKDIEALSAQIVHDYQAVLEQNGAYQHIDYSAQLVQAREHYPAGETAARARLIQFTGDDINNYNASRDQPILQGTSHMSAYLTIGSISPRACYLQAIQAQDKLSGNDSDNEDINRWISELAWRDFYRHVLTVKPELVRHKAYKAEIDAKINWSYNKEDFEAWCTGKTGIPFVDAAMRSLNANGFMHNRLRMVTAMFLTKDLLIDWRWGERYFMSQLIDGDFASNNGGWQWSASTGTDSAPYFRIMNPFSQGKSHDAKALFIKTWLPELKDVPASILHDENRLRKALSKGGDFADIDYPAPMVDHKKARQLAITEFKKE